MATQQKSIKAVRGTRDLLPPDTELWNFVESAARDVFRLYNFHEIRTPIFEQTQLFARSVGEETDIVSKEMYTWREGEGSSEVALLNAWLAVHPDVQRSDLDRKVGRGPGRPDAMFENEQGEIVIVELTFGPSMRTLEQLTTYAQVVHDIDPGRAAMRVVAYPQGTAISASLMREGKSRGIRFEAVDVELPQSLTLRPENTAGVVRAYIEHRLWERPGLQKLYYIGPQFRRERPQKGRYRQFFQIGAEVIGPPSAGSESPAVDAEVLELLATLLDRLGIANWRLELNSVGCANDRPRYYEALRQALAGVVDKMCGDCQHRAVTNPLRVFDCKVPADQPIIDKLPRIADYLDDSCRAHFQAVQDILTAVGVPFVINDRLVRGLDYYTRTAFEFTHGALGAQNAILGGGRYDGLSEALGGPAAPGIGFAIGEDRLVLALQESSGAMVKPPDAYIAALGPGMNREAARLARELRRRDVVVETGDESFRLKKSLETASKLGARYAVIVGENEVAADAFALKNLATGEQVTVPRAELPNRILRTS